MLIKSIAVASFLFLGACAQASGFVEVGIQKGRAAADIAAEANLAVVCGTTIGAFYRLENVKQQVGLELICSSGDRSLLNNEN